MRVLVTGASGFVGSHVVRELESAGHQPLLLDLKSPTQPSPHAFFEGDLRNAGALRSVVRESRPEACIHLGGVAFVPLGWTDPDLVFGVNTCGTAHLLEAFRHEAPGARLLVVTSAEVYGRIKADRPLAENEPLRPTNPYGVSKMSADLLALLYARRYAMHAMTARPGNHIGPGQSLDFVATAFADQVARIAMGKAEPVIRVGNLDGDRDFTDVRDVARAYRLLIERGRAGEAYNIASGRTCRIRFLLDELCRLAAVRPSIEIDPARFRPTDAHPSLDITKLRQDTGWSAALTLETTLGDILEEVRRRNTEA